MTDLIDCEAVRRYLQRLERGIQLLPPEDRSAIVSEIKSHIADRLAEPDPSVDLVLDSLGDADELARSYLDQYRLEDALARSANVSLLIVIVRRAARSLIAFVTGFTAVSLYLIALGFLAVAALKPLFPQTTGFWFENGHFNYGSFRVAPGATELMGYWFIPVSVLAAFLSYVAATAIMRLGGRALARTRPKPA